MTVVGTVYLLHFERPYKHARHYIGWTTGDLTRRMRQHRNGTGARLMQVVTSAGIDFGLARTWTGGRNLERSLKNRGGASRACPLCGVKARVTGWDPPANDWLAPTDTFAPDEITVVRATCGCDRIISIAANLLATATFSCGDCQQPIIPLIFDVPGGQHALTV